MSTDDDITELVGDQPRPATVIRFRRHLGRDHLDYAAVFAAGRWFITGSLAGRRVFTTAEFADVLADNDILTIDTAKDWTAITVHNMTGRA